ncbi:MAG: DUF4342 domain-containing protein [Chloroflexota bacterium]
MSKKKAKAKAKEKVEEIIEITEEDVAKSDPGRSWSEEFEMAGKDVMGFIKGVWNEANVRRIIVRNENGETLLNLPIAVGVGLVVVPQLIIASAVGVLIALATKCTVKIERVAEPAEEQTDT